MHGVFGHGGGVLAGGGGLDALVFRNAAAGGVLRAPPAFVTASGPARSIVANAPPREVATATLGNLASGTPVRIAIHVIAAPTPAFAEGIACALRAVIESGGKRVSAPLAYQYVTPDMASVALALRSVVTTAAAGDALLQVTVQCTRESANPVLLLSPAIVVAEPFVAMPGIIGG
jgi:hypothetical protein